MAGYKENQDNGSENSTGDALTIETTNPDTGNALRCACGRV